MTLVSANGVFFRGGEGRLTPTAPKDGFTLAPNGFNGWTSGVDMRIEDIPIPLGHGSFDVPGYSAPRFLTLSGICYAQSEGELSVYESRFRSIFSDGSYGQVEVETGGKKTWGYGRVSTAKFDVTITGRQALYSIQFKFANPRRFGNATEAASGVSQINWGDFASTPVHFITGNMPTGYQITGPFGRAVIVTRACVPGQLHAYDHATGRLSINGAVATQALLQADTWAYPPALPIACVLVPATGTGTLATRVTDTYK